MSIIVRLPEFEGAFDLLLHLIRTNEMEIEAISVLSIIDQYLDLISRYTLDESSDFILMASSLIAMKARHLNKGRIEDEREGGEDPLENLVEKLKLYRKIKEIGTFLKNRESLHYHFFKEAEPREEEGEQRYQIDLLTLALERVMDRLSRYDDERQEFFRLKRKKYITVKERKDYILKLLGKTRQIAFSEICDTREELVASFLALLELLKYSQICVFQEDTYAEIYIARPDLSVYQ